MASVASDSLPDADIRERIVAAGVLALSDDSTAELTVRRVAKLAGSSTMCIYTKFGGRTGMVEAIYRRGFETLRDALSVATSEMVGPAAQDPDERIVAIATAHRRFALDRPALYALLFERPLPDFDPTPQLRTEALAAALTLLTEEVRHAQQHGLLLGRDPAHTSYLLWTAIHGMTSIELTHVQRSALPAWAVSSPGSGEQVLVHGVRALLAGLKATQNAVDLRYASLIRSETPRSG